MSADEKTPAADQGNGGPNTDLAGASINSDSTVVPFRKQALRTADAVIGQLAATETWVRNYQHTVDDLRGILGGALGVAEAAGADLDALAAMQGVNLDEQQPTASERESVPADWKPAPGAGLLGALGSLTPKNGGCST